MGLPKPYYDEDGITIYNADCMDILPHIEPGSIDLVLTDPPYGLGDKWRGGFFNGKNGSGKLWGETPEWDKTTIGKQLLNETLVRGKQAICWGGNYYWLPPTRCWLIWDKVQSFSAADFEMAWTDLDAAPRIFRMSRIDAYQNCAKEQKQHPTQKPIQLIEWCISLADNPLTVLDPFLGSGTTAVAAKNLGRRCIGIEMEEKYCEIAVRRLAQGVLPL